MEQKRTIIITAVVAVALLLGIGIYFTSVSKSTAKNSKETLNSQVSATITPTIETTTENNQNINTDPIALPVDQETDQTLADVDNALKALDSNSDIPPLQQNELQ
jgi:flagellar basal body-associated protein FliL